MVLLIFVKSVSNSFAVEFRNKVQKMAELNMSVFSSRKLSVQFNCTTFVMLARINLLN